MEKKILLMAYTGAGKTHAADLHEEIADCDFTELKWIFDEQYSGLPLEQKKGVDKRVLNPEYPENFIKLAVETLQRYPIVTVPLDMNIMNAGIVDRICKLHGNVEVILAYPQKSDFDEYMRRFKERGNNEEFLDKRSKLFSSDLEGFEKLENHTKIVLKPNQYLYDALIENGLQSSLNILEKSENGQDQ